jgi:type II secretory pathway component PulJ
LVAVSLTALLISSLTALFQAQLKSARRENARSDALQNAWVALGWLERDLRAARSVTLAADGTRIYLEVPEVQRPMESYLEPHWEEVTYSLVGAQLQRSIHGSHNPVAEGIADFRCSFEENGRIVAVRLKVTPAERPVEVATKVWLRNKKG